MKPASTEREVGEFLFSENTTSFMCFPYVKHKPFSTLLLFGSVSFTCQEAKKALATQAVPYK